MRQIHFVGIALLSFFLSIEAWTTLDGKNVPALPVPAAPVICSTVAQIYMAFRLQRPGRAVVIKNGTYDISGIEPIRIDSPYVSIRGETDNPNGVVLVANGINSCVSVEEEMFQVCSNNALFANLTISESRCHGIKFQQNNNDRTVIHNVKFLNIGERMIKGPLTLAAAQCSIRYCHFEDNVIPPLSRCGNNTLDMDGNYIAGMDIMSADSWVIHDCYFLNIKGPTGGGRGAVFFWQGCRNMTVERNTFLGCDRSICYGNASGTTDNTGGTIRNNFIVRGAGIGIEICNSSGLHIYNNTLYSSDPTYFRAIWIGTSSAIDLRNNIIFGNISGTANTNANNVMKNASSDASTNWFVSRNQANLHLTSSATQAINAGATGLVTDDWDGHRRSDTDALPDIGADEYNSISSAADISALKLSGIALLRVQPNPCNPGTIIRYDLATKEPHTIAIFDLKGRLVKDLYHGYGPGHAIQWAGTDNNGAAQAAGMYILRLQTRSGEKTARIALIK